MPPAERRLPDPVIRAAGDDDTRRIAEIHVQSWQWAYRDLLPEAFLGGLDSCPPEATRHDPLD